MTVFVVRTNYNVRSEISVAQELADWICRSNDTGMGVDCFDERIVGIWGMAKDRGGEVGAQRAAFGRVHVLYPRVFVMCYYLHF